MGDREQLIQAVLNIARNAAQAILGRSEAPDAGKIVLRTRPAHRVTIARQLSRLAIDLQVIDNGPGIPEELRDRIFYPLVSGRADGTGLGLTLAVSFVEYHRGVIECDSRPGRTVFRILLPTERERSQTDGEPAA
jgi:two-component system nitrogen regulation sensor histidine kinase GlnL